MCNRFETQKIVVDPDKYLQDLYKLPGRRSGGWMEELLFDLLTRYAVSQNNAK